MYIHIYWYIMYLQTRYMYIQMGKIVLHPADGGQKPETIVQGLYLLSFGTAHLIFHVHVRRYMYMYIGSYPLHNNSTVVNVYNTCTYSVSHIKLCNLKAC